MRIKIPEEIPYESNPENSPTYNSETSAPNPPWTYSEYSSNQGMKATILGTIQEFGDEGHPLFSPVRSSSPVLSSLRLAKLLLGGGEVGGQSSPNVWKKGIHFETPTKLCGISPALSGCNLAERASGLRSETEELQDRVDELEELVQKQNREEEMLMKKAKSLEKIVDHMVSNKIHLAEETSKAMSALRGELSRIGLCNNEIGKSCGDR